MPRRAVVASYCVIVSSGIGVAGVTTMAQLRAQSIVRVSSIQVSDRTSP